MGTFGDSYIAKWLLQNTENNNIQWQHKEPSLFFVDFNEGKSRVRVEIGSVQSRTGAVIIIKLTSPGLGEVQIQEPMRKVFSLRGKYDTPEDSELAETMKRLLAVVSHQYSARELNYFDTTEERKQEIYNRLLGGI